jgi:hypothetical protein
MLTPIHYLLDDEDGDPKRLDVRRDTLTVWLPEGADEGVDPEWTRDRIRRHEDDVDEWGQPLPEMIAAARAESWANLDWYIRDAKTTVKRAERRIAELKDIKAGFVASIIRFRASRACWPDA